MTTTQRAYTDETLPQLLALIEGADSVELKVTVAEHKHAATVHALGLDPLDAQIRQVFFFDTPDLALNKQGVVVRARRVQKRRDDSVIKLRPVVPAELPKAIRQSPRSASRSTRCPAASCARASMKAMLGADDVRESVHGKRPLAQALLEGAARGSTRSMPPRGRDRRPRRARPDLRAQAQVPGGGVRPPAGRGDVAVSGRLAHPRALDEVRAGRRPSRSRRRRAASSRRAGSTSAASSRPRRARRWSSSAPRFPA